MHSFSTVSALLAAALATFTHAAPINVGSVIPSGVAGGEVSDATTLLSGVTGATGTNGVVTTVEGDVNTLAGGLVNRDVDSTIEGAVKSIESQIKTRQTVNVATSSGTLSVAAVFSSLGGQITPFTTELTYLTPSNVTVSSVTNIITNIKAPFAAVVPQLQGLVGQPTNVIFGSVDGNSTLSASQVAAFVAPALTSLLSAAGTVVQVAGTQSGVTNPLTDLTAGLSTVLSVLGSLDGGILTELSPAMMPVLGNLSSSGVLSILGLNNVASIFDLTGLNL